MANNSNVLIEDKPILLQRMCNEGSIFMNDIVNNYRKMLHKQLIKVYGEVYTIQNYNQLVSPLPQEWKRHLLTRERNELVCLPPITHFKWLTMTNIA
jgi:hypothetical protein